VHLLDSSTDIAVAECHRDIRAGSEVPRARDEMPTGRTREAVASLEDVEGRERLQLAGNAVQDSASRPEETRGRRRQSAFEGRERGSLLGDAALRMRAK
jgi:hypothetical protein